MKITEVIKASKESKDTISSDTRSSAITGDQTQDIVPQDIVSENDLALEVDNLETHPDHSAIAEGVSQILRRTKGKAPKQGFRCSSGPRKGRIVAKPSTCFQKLDPAKGAKIRKKRQIKAKLAGKKLARTKRTGAGAQRLKSIQPTKMKGSQPKLGKTVRSGRRPLIKSKTIKPKRR